MNRDIIKKRINELEIDLEWLDYNLSNVDGIAVSMQCAEAIKKIGILGKKSYVNKYMDNEFGIHSGYEKSFRYNHDTEQYIKSLRAGVAEKLERIKKLESK